MLTADQVDAPSVLRIKDPLSPALIHTPAVAPSDFTPHETAYWSPVGVETSVHVPAVTSVPLTSNSLAAASVPATYSPAPALFLPKANASDFGDALVPS